MRSVASPEEFDRLYSQVVENLLPTELTEVDEVEAYRRLSRIGISAAAISKRQNGQRPSLERTGRPLKAKAATGGAQAMIALIATRTLLKSVKPPGSSAPMIMVLGSKLTVERSMSVMSSLSRTKS